MIKTNCIGQWKKFLELQYDWGTKEWNETLDKFVKSEKFIENFLKNNTNLWNNGKVLQKREKISVKYRKSL